jgi:Ca2+-binding EF-hand superfamily protein
MNNLRFAVTLGIVSFSSALMAQEHQRPFETLDSNGNGSISFAEFQENSINMLTRIDTDENGVLTIDEFLNARPNRGPRNGNQRGEQNGEGRNSSGNSGERPDKAGNEQREEQRANRRTDLTDRAIAAFQEMDLDGDKVVSVAEFQEANFLRMDRDSNGVLTAEELRPSRGSHGRGRRGERTPPA